jgi:hypothetical protein
MPKEAPLAVLQMRDAPMRLSLSAAVANDLGALRKGLKDLADRLGHSACATGCNELHLRLERDFVVNRSKSAVALNPQPLPPLALPQDPIPWKAVRVTAAGSVLDNIDALSGALEKVLGRLGCPACCSGFDILFQREMDGFVIDARQGLRGTGRFA